MPRGQYPRNKGKLAAPALVPDSIFTSLSWWDKLNKDEQTAVKTEGEQLAVALLNYGRSRLAVGEHLLKIKEVLEPHKLFVKFLRNFHFSVKSAYRYMNGFTNAKKMLAEPVLQGAMARGLNMIGESEDKPLGIYTEAARQLPPPTNPTAQQVNAWLDSVETVRKKLRGSTINSVATIEAQVGDPELMLKECVRFVENRYKKLPANGRTRTAWAHRLVSYVMTVAGIEHAETVKPVAIPEGFRAAVGRPRLVTSNQAA